MQMCKCVLLSFATFGSIVAQQPNPPKTPEPGKLDFTLPPFKPQGRLISPKSEPGKLDFTFPTLKPQRRSMLQNQIARPTEYLALEFQNRSTSTCSAPLLKGKLAEDIHFFIRQIRPSKNQMALMPQVGPPAPSCAEKQGSASRR
jgi:hypothetical protein